MSKWKQLVLGKMGYTYGGLTNKTILDFGTGKPFLPYMNIFSNGKINPRFVNYVQIYHGEKQNAVKYGDLFFTTSSETVEEVGMTSVLLNDMGEAYLNSFCFGFRLNNFDDLLPEFAPFLFRGSVMRKKISLFGQGSTRYNLPKTELLQKLTIHLPTIPEQRKIAQILSTADLVIEKTKIAIAKYKAIKQGIVYDLFTRGIDVKTGKLRPKHIDAPQLYKQSALGWIPKQWEVETFENATLKIADRDHFTPIYYDSGVPIISPKDFDENEEISFKECKYISYDAHLKNSQKTDLKTGDLVFTRIGALLGKVCIVEDWMPEFSILHSACMIRINPTTMRGHFYCQFIKSYFFQKQIKVEVQSIGVPDLGLEKIKSFLVLQPSFEEQKIIEEKLLSIEKLIKQEKNNLSKQQSIKSGLMNDLLNGKKLVTVTNELETETIK